MLVLDKNKQFKKCLDKIVLIWETNQIICSNSGIQYVHAIESFDILTNSSNVT